MSKTNLIKTIFIALSAVFSFLIWVRFEKEIDLISVLDIFSVTLLLVLSAALLLFALFLFSDKTPFFVLSSFLLVFLFVLGFSLAHILMLLFVFLFYFYAKKRLYFGNKNNLKINMYPLVFYGAPTIISIMAILLAVASYSYPFRIDDIKLSPKSFESFSLVSSKIIRFQFPFYEKDMTVDDFLLKTISEQSGIKESVLKNRYKKEIENQRIKMSKDMGIELLGGDKLNDVLAKTANMYIDKLLMPNKKIVPIFIAFAVFLTIKSFGFILNRLVVLFVWIYYKILLRYNLVQIKDVQIKKEVLEIV